MKKPNNKFRNNNYSQVYSLNYKFDSNSIAGKICGTALELIKKYNELAKDSQNNNDYVTAEVFRQYAEHYRKIVTDINEKKNNNNNSNNNNNNQKRNNQTCAPDSQEITTKSEEISVEEELSLQAVKEPENEIVQTAKSSKKEFKIIEISEAKKEQETKKTPAGKRTVRKKVAVAE